jgi:RNA polymerase sigma-70 factor, ECF subfamily
MENQADEDLLWQFRAGGQAGNQALNELFERYHSKVAAWCYRITGDSDMAADLAQEVFLKVYQNLESFRGGAKFSTWVYSITRNHCMDGLRSKSRRREDSAEDVLDSMTDTRSDDIRTVLERDQEGATLREVMREELDETEAKVMTMHYVHEMPLATVTRILGLENQSGAKAFIVSARRKIERAMARRLARTQSARGQENAG